MNKQQQLIMAQFHLVFLLIQDESSLGLEYFIGVFIIVAIFYIISVAAFVMEWCCHRENINQRSEK